MPNRFALAIVLLLSALTVGLHAEDLGTIGPTYDIAERDLIEVITDQFRRMEKTGELAGMQEDYKRKVIGGIERPRPVPGIRPTETAHTFFIDPTWTLDRNVVDGKGNVLYPAGTRINPLDYERLIQALLFFDGRDKKQIAFARRFIAESKMRVKPILVGGEPMKLMRQWKREVFFDQGGALSRRFSITQAPAVVSQQRRQLRVDEIRP
ncbi:MAG: type-F conjugative transfer system protein TraW [Rhodocyclaceae bacterium]|nr:type-F conjugative transfer system protein TraW [Rhodocyclaceae bacterium]